jgi:hypothetical protein
MAMYDPEPVAPEPALVAPEPSPVGRSRVVPPQRRSMTSALVLGLAAVVAVGGLAFAAGRLTAPAAASATGFDRTGTNGRGFNGNFPRASGAVGGLGGAFRGGGGLGITGTVTAVTSDSITIQLASGQTVSIPTTSSTTYHQQTAGSASDVQVGKQVQVDVARNTSGSGGAQASPGAGFGNFGAASSVTVLGQ